MDASRAVVDYATHPDDYLPHVIHRCVEKATALGSNVRFRLNGAEVVVRPNQSTSEVDAEVQRQWQTAAAPPVQRDVRDGEDMLA